MIRALPMSCLAVMGALAFVTAGCSGGDEPGDACGEPTYAEGSTDEAWFSILDAKDRVQKDDTHGAEVTSPTENEALTADAAAPKITWTSTLSASIDSPRLPAGPVPASRTSFAERVLDWVYPAAWAHEPPVTGPMHLLEITIPNRDCPVRVLTAQTEWQVDSNTWTLMQSHKGDTMKIEVTSVYLSENRITEGPYRRSAPRTFTVK